MSQSAVRAEQEEISTETREPRRILYVHNGADLYGASRSLLRLVTGLDRRKFRPHVVLPEEGPLADALRRAGVSLTIQPSLAVIHRRLFRSWRLSLLLLRIPASTVALTRLIRRKRIDLVHTNLGTVMTSGFAARLAGVPHVWHIRDWFGEFGRLWPWYARYLVWSSDRIICVSTPIARQFPASPKVAVIHNGLPLEEFERISDERVAVFRRRFGLGSHKLVGIVGRIKLQRKGQDVFARAAASLHQRLPGVRFVVIGSPFPGNEEHLGRLQDLVAGLGVSDKMVITGDVEDVQAAVKSLDVLVLASSQPEPFAGVVLEAMALGVPVVGTRIGGTVEQIEDGVSGLLVEPNDPRALASAIERLLWDRALRESIRSSARVRVEERFGFSRMRWRLEAVYEGCLGSAGPHPGEREAERCN